MSDNHIEMTPAQRDRIYLADMWQNQASYKAKGWKAYYIEDGALTPLIANRCTNRWGKIFLLTDEEYFAAQALQQKVSDMKQLYLQQIALLSELMESSIVYNIIKP